MTRVTALIGNFATLLTPYTGNDEWLAHWIDHVWSEQLPHLHAFTRGLKLDRTAMNDGLTRSPHIC